MTEELEVNPYLMRLRVCDVMSVLIMREEPTKELLGRRMNDGIYSQRPVKGRPKQ